jgi:DNA-directed RNA polymerase subunit alpha
MSDHNRELEQDLELSIRGTNLARRVGARTAGELARFTAEELLSAKGFGETSLREIRDALARRGLRLGMSLAELEGRPGLQARIVPRRERPLDKAEIDLERALNMSLCELELSVRATNCLESEAITTVRDLVSRSDEELLEVRNFGLTTLKEVRAKLAGRGLRLGMADL